MAFNIYKPIKDRPLENVSSADMIRNQRILSGTNPEYLSTKGVFFLDTLILESGQVVEIQDGEGNSVGTGITGFTLYNNHIRLDYGIKIIGTVIMAKGYIIENAI